MADDKGFKQGDWVFIRDADGWIASGIVEDGDLPNGHVRVEFTERGLSSMPVVDARLLQRSADVGRYTWTPYQLEHHAGPKGYRNSAWGVTTAHREVPFTE